MTICIFVIYFLLKQTEFQKQQNTNIIITVLGNYMMFNPAQLLSLSCTTIFEAVLHKPE